MHLLKLNVGQITFTKLNTNKAEIQRKPNHQICRQPYRHKGRKLMQDETTQSTKQSTINNQQSTINNQLNNQLNNQPTSQRNKYTATYSIFVVD